MSARPRPERASGVPPTNDERFSLNELSCYLGLQERNVFNSSLILQLTASFAACACARALRTTLAEIVFCLIRIS